jgi:hypothetical protein
LKQRALFLRRIESQVEEGEQIKLPKGVHAWVPVAEESLKKKSQAGAKETEIQGRMASRM